MQLDKNILKEKSQNWIDLARNWLLMTSENDKTLKSFNKATFMNSFSTGCRKYTIRNRNYLACGYETKSARNAKYKWETKGGDKSSLRNDGQLALCNFI